MREQLMKYVDLLFAGAPGASDIKQEILQNTLDRYDDLIAQGKSPEAAYSLSISGIGDISEVLGGAAPQSAPSQPHYTQAAPEENKEKKLKRAVAIAMYILCPVPLFILSEFGLDTMGLCLTLLLVAAATALMVISGKGKPINQDYNAPQSQEVLTPRQELRNSVRSLIWAVGLAAYFIISFSTQAWYITWVIFPLTASVQGLTTAIMDLKEAK